ncbi:transcription factor SCREAM2 isoform X2 [Physcomitrium patens]|uniref:Plant bHLH transcription factor ACT-like domain-containing protein n=1 Tax=Physcomitrium patens TaxID=3218 RepID=A0A2K1IR98_PHYPA|nr:uncharacterized protein LOC112273966 isoform X2 [Physcomitrium patens]PNR31788.1 hypothetical protein PHYPA_025911 [Physcomitrium patens]|eukprot:XP_024358843.1 uncharacterized protein LOC112273966 isoform X2 [Physcomitrella patens]
MGLCIRDILLEPEEKEGVYSDAEWAMSDSESDEEPIALQRVDTPGFLKRTYGVLAYDSSLERKHKYAKLDEQLDDLRAVLPNATKSKERTSVVLDAYQYIATLQRQVDDLSAELLEEDVLSPAQTQDEECDQRDTVSSYSSVHVQPLVEVVRRDGLLEVWIVCANRPSLLVDVMEAVESRGLAVTHARIACHNDIVFEYLRLENEHSAPNSKAEETKEEDVKDFEASVKAMLVHAICNEASHVRLQ